MKQSNNLNKHNLNHNWSKKLDLYLNLNLSPNLNFCLKIMEISMKVRQMLAMQM